MSPEKSKKKISRRKFFIRGGLGTLGVLALGTYVFRNPLRRMALEMAGELVPAYSGEGTEANLWFEITSENRVILYSPKVEMGQGTFTSLAQIVADELDVDIDQIEVIAAPTDSGVIDGMSTGGSLSVASLWMPLREMAATLREMVKSEAAIKLNVPVEQVTTAQGQVSGNGSIITYAEAVAELDTWNLPKTPPLRPVEDYKFVGKPIDRVDLVPKVFGDPIFGLDAEMPDMLYATIVRSPYIGGILKHVNSIEADQMPGVVKIMQGENWVGVIAQSYPEALSARTKVEIEWDVPKEWTELEMRELLQVGKGDEMITQKKGRALDPKSADTQSLEFTSPLGAHAQIEPNGAVAFVEDDHATIIISTQVIGITQKQVAKALNFKKENVNIIPTYLGGGFGRRLDTSHAIEAAQMSIAVGRPVKYIWTRQEEFQHDTFRPPTHHIMRGKIGSDGFLESLEHHYASGDVAIGSPIFPSAIHSILGTDIGAMRGGNIQYDLIPNHRAVQWHSTLPFATSWWRSLGLLANTFAIESFVDEMCLASDKDPVEFRINRISDNESGKRLKRVITEVAKMADYRDLADNGRAMGLAASTDAGSPCAHVAEVSIEDNEIKVHKVYCVMDCGIAVNPDQVIAQCEGSIIMGLSASLKEAMTIKDGQLYPTIYGPYRMALMKDAPRVIEVKLLQGVDRPLPVGEPPLGPIAAAVGNAVRRISGQRLTDLPLQL